MQYIEPVGAQGPANDFGHDYVDKNAGLGIAGSFLSAKVPEHLQIEIVNAIVAAGLTPSGANLKQLAQAVQSGKSTYAVATGSANAWTVAPNLAVPAYAAGRVLNIIAPATNTSTTVNMNVSGLGNRRIKKADGSDPAIGDLVAGRAYATLDDGTNIRTLTPLPSDMAAGAAVAALLQPIFPEVLTGANALTATASTGQIVINPAQNWQHRGLINFSSDSFSAPDRTFVTAASKTYHLVWDAPGTGLATPLATYPAGRFSLIDRTAASPVETDPSYDTTFDRMLCQKVVTSAGNVPTVTPLKNRALLSATLVKTTLETSASGWSGLPNLAATLNWARSPQLAIKSFDTDYSVSVIESVNNVAVYGDRYAMQAFVGGYATGPVYISGAVSVEARI